MFVYYYVYLTRPFAAVEERLLQLTNGLAGWAGAAYREGEEIRARLGIGGERELAAKTIRITPGRPVRGSAETSIPLTWEATGAAGLFPRMEGEIVVANLGRSFTQVALRGSYQPPLGAVGRALDRTLFHRVAEASVKGFLDRVARALDGEGDLDGSAGATPVKAG